jgi:hypothetical protein
MSHLVCTQHDRRVVVTERGALHRSDRTPCPTPTVRAGIAVHPVHADFFPHRKGTS